MKLAQRGWFWWALALVAALIVLFAWASWAGEPQPTCRQDRLVYLGALIDIDDALRHGDMERVGDVTDKALDYARRQGQLPQR